MEKTMSRDEGYPQRRRTPSFSSTLLDAICRSIDESKSNLDEDPQLGRFDEITNPKQSTPKQSNSPHCVKKERMNLRRAVMIEDWMEKQSSQSSHFTTSSSSESTSGAAFSSSETETPTYKSRPKPCRPKSEKKHQQQQEQKPKRESSGGGDGGFSRTKLKALTIYGELNQKVKQPISPASRIASFLSSIFNTGNVKKAKMCYPGAAEGVGSGHHKSKSPCFSSSASSFSRSCMSKTPTSSSSSSAKGKRSVRFYPVSVILGEDSQSQSCGHRFYQNDPSLLPISSVRKMTRVSSIKEVKKNSAKVKENCFVKSYQNSCKNNQFGFRGTYDNGEEVDDGDEDDEALSCSSSDLFELDHIVGAGRYQEELPVYETTNLERNKAIANGLRL